MFNFLFPKKNESTPNKPSGPQEYRIRLCNDSAQPYEVYRISDNTTWRFQRIDRAESWIKGMQEDKERALKNYEQALENIRQSEYGDKGD